MLIDSARRIPTARSRTGPLTHTACCGWALRGTHVYTLACKRINAHRYYLEHKDQMRTHYRNRYRYDDRYLLQRVLGPVSKQKELPTGLVELATTRRRMMEAAKLVGNWRTNDQGDDPS
jgi:hypothetical protein